MFVNDHFVRVTGDVFLGGVCLGVLEGADVLTTPDCYGLLCLHFALTWMKI